MQPVAKYVHLLTYLIYNNKYTVDDLLVDWYKSGCIVLCIRSADACATAVFI